MTVNFIHIKNEKTETNPYFEALAVSFPTLKAELEEEDPHMIFMKMEIFARYTNQQIEASNLTELNRCFEFQEAHYERMNDLLLNALSVSYCEALLLGENADKMGEVVNLMPTKLRTHYLEYEEFYNQL